MDDEELKREEESLEYEEYESEESDDTFEIWKVKKYVDTQIETENDSQTSELKKYIDRCINQLIVWIVVGALIFGYIIKNF